jgi:gluconokinase
MPEIMEIRSAKVPRIVFLFGLAGAGKTFCGRLIAERLGYFCYDLDADSTPKMKQAIAEGRPFTDEMRDEFFAIVCQRIEALRKEHPKIIVMQAAYKERHRVLVSSLSDEMEMVWVDAPDALIVERLLGRGDAVSAEYADRIRANFEPPKGQCKRLLNDVSDGDLLWERFSKLFELEV